MFTPNEEDLQFLFDSAGMDVLINDVPQQAIITLPPLSDSEERYIHTLQRINMGDMVTFDDNKYLVMNETISPRNGKYKARIRHLNYKLQIPGEVIQDYLRDENGNIITDNFGKPIPITIEGDPIYIPAIVEQQAFTIEEGQIRIPNNEILITVQDNEVNREKLILNFEFNLMTKTWKVTNVDLTRKGLMIITCQQVQSS
ncbi:hypothetical protein LIZ76_11330 [Caldibacillus sp. 210928-DFI.2.22]|uniref:hypothetical protein n=1 Tax=unclassified Caldibacillus TaxID=2641266 RepID=UPI001D07EE02|nr:MULTISPECIES: hypothetical protein [unclassified Caldibacillus]MCB7070565.1 hypothetical protein [Caldibacillus sp. 210928-DFI.2.22]MCB7073727.1 hypothetical protein [Caldibacillus sp. 210928-DFI.2.18]